MSPYSIENLWANVKPKLKSIYRYITQDFFQAIVVFLFGLMLTSTFRGPIEEDFLYFHVPFFIGVGVGLSLVQWPEELDEENKLPEVCLEDRLLLLLSLSV